MKNKINYLIGILFGSLVLSGCAISVNTTKHNEQPWIGNPFDMSRTDYILIKEVSSEFSGTYVLGIGGWKSKSRNAVEELLSNADLSKHQQVVNITYKTRVNVILCGLVVKRVTSATGQLIQFSNNDASVQGKAISSSVSHEEESPQLTKLASIEKYHARLTKVAKQYGKQKSMPYKSYERLYTCYILESNEENLSLLEQVQKIILKYLSGNLPAEFDKAFTNNQTTEVIAAIYKQYM